jgi:hypothetical protein
LLSLLLMVLSGVARLAARLLPQLSVGVNGAWYFGDSIRYGIDAAYENSRFALKGEFLGQGRNRASLSDDRDWYGLGAVFRTTSSGRWEVRGVRPPWPEPSVEESGLDRGPQCLSPRAEPPADIRLRLP